MRIFLLVLLGLLLPVSTHAENFCALTFDDGPSKYTGRLLDALQRRGVSATFFVLGENAIRFPETLRRALEGGFEVGNHSWSHPNLHNLTFAEQEREIKRTSDFIKSVGGNPKYFRPPYGNSDEGVQQIVAKEGMTEIFWTVDSQDWNRRSSDYSLLTDGRGKPFPPGGMHGIFLFHDIQKHTVDDIDLIIDGLILGGCETFVTISDYLKRVNKRELANISAARNIKKKKPASPLPATTPPASEEGGTPPQMSQDSSPKATIVDSEFFKDLPLLPSHKHVIP